MADWRPSRPSRHLRITVNSGGGGDIPMNIRGEDSPSTPGTPTTSRNLLLGPAARRVYNSPGLSQSSENLLSPTTAQGLRRPNHDFSPVTPSPLSSRRTSFDSVGSRDPLRGPSASPFDDSRANSRDGSDEDVNTQTVLQKYSITPTPDLMLFPEDLEADDYMHNPDPDEPDIERCGIWSMRGMLNVGGLVFVILGALMLFVAYPVLYGLCYPLMLRSSLTIN